MKPSEMARYKTIRSTLFAIPDTYVYAVLDGASIPELLPALAEHSPKHTCLYRGELAPDLEAAAPYLVLLDPRNAFTKWVISEGWGKHWGIFAVSGAELPMLRRHFRRFLMVKSPEGKQLYFRYYDPRVLRIYLPTCNSAEAQIIFGPVVSYAFEAQKPAILLRARQGGETVALEEVPIQETSG